MITLLTSEGKTSQQNPLGVGILKTPFVILIHMLAECIASLREFDERMRE